MGRGLFVVVSAFSAVVAACSSSSSLPAKFAGRTPQYHYSVGSSCRSTRPPGDGASDAAVGTCNGGDEGTCCTSDAQCTAGSNGRCVREGYADQPRCSYDDCASSSDCTTGNACACGTWQESSANVCVPSNCRADADCGSGGFCSPSAENFSAFDRNYTGVYCHTPNDECLDDSDCADAGSTFGQSQHCAFATEGGRWVFLGAGAAG